MALIFIRVHSPLFFCHFSTAVFSYELSRSRSLLLKSFHIRCPDLGHFVTSQLRPFHAECPDPGHGTRNYVRNGDRMCQLIIYCLGCIVGLVVLLVYYSDCVDRSGSLSGGAFNQLKLVTLSIVLAILYLLKTVLQGSLLQCLNSLYKSDEVF